MFFHRHLTPLFFRHLATHGFASSRELTGDARDEAKGSQHSKGSEGFDVKAPRFASGLAAGVGVFGHHLQSHAEQPGRGGRGTGRGRGRGKGEEEERKRKWTDEG